MTIKSILAPITGYEETDRTLVGGLQLARRLGAVVDALHVRPDPREAIPIVAEGAVGPVITQVLELAENEAEDRAQKAAHLFETACRKAGATASGPNAGAHFETVVGRAPDVIPLRARVADLVLMGRVPEQTDVDWRLTLEATLMESGRPVLLLPAGYRAWVCRTIAIAWNGSLEAAHAASTALPLLAQAERVLLLAAVKREPVEPSLEALAGWLGHHGIMCERRQVALEGWPVGEQLIDEAAAAGADLVVMGAYGHSRMHETIFGGATRAVLNEAKLAVFMAH